MFGIGKKQPSAKVLADQQQNQRIAEGIESANSTREKYFGDIAKFEVDPTIADKLQQEQLLTDISETYKTTWIEGDNTQLTAYDKLNQAKIFLQNLENSHPTLWQKLTKFSIDNNILQTEVNRTVVAWLVR